MIIVVYKSEGRRIYAPKCGVRRLCLESNSDQQERWDPWVGQYYRQHIDLLACVWVNEGTDLDLAQAKAWAETSGWDAAIVPPDDEGHPLHWARKKANDQFWKRESAGSAP